MSYKLLFSKATKKDAEKIKKSNLNVRCKALLEIIEGDPFATFPPVEKVVGELNGFYSRRINIQHRLIYSVDEEQKIVKILRMWTYYE